MTTTGQVGFELIDIGINIRDKDDIISIHQRAAAANVQQLILTGTCIQSVRLARTLCAQRAGLWYTAGIHPHNARTLGRLDHQEECTRLYETDLKCVALGEMGLDYARMFSPQRLQLEALDQQLQAAARLHAPLFLHDRDNEYNPVGSQQALLSLLDKHGIAPAQVKIKIS